MLKELSSPWEAGSSTSHTTLAPTTVADANKLPSLVGGGSSPYDRLVHQRRIKLAGQPPSGVHAGESRSTWSPATKWSTGRLAENPRLDKVRLTTCTEYPMAYETLDIDWQALGQLHDFAFHSKTPIERNAGWTLGAMLK